MIPAQKSILIVEDDVDTADMLAEMVTLIGYQPFQSSGAAPAMTILSAEKPDAVILDWKLPDLSGIDFLRHIRHNPKFARIPVIMISAKALPSDIKFGLEAGASLYLVKPISYTELKYAIESVVQKP